MQTKVEDFEHQVERIKAEMNDMSEIKDKVDKVEKDVQEMKGTLGEARRNSRRPKRNAVGGGATGSANWARGGRHHWRNERGN